MTDDAVAAVDGRVLVLMPTAKDAERAGGMLAPAGVPTRVCRDLPEVCRELAVGAAAVLLTEEALLADRGGRLAAALSGQPAWSAVPLVVLTAEADDGRLEKLADLTPHITLVERPVRARSLLSVVRAAVRARRHQYAARDALAERERQAEELRASEVRLRRNADTFIRLIRGNPFGLYVVDADFRLAEVSQGAGRVFANVRPLLGRDFAEVLRVIWPEPSATEFIGRFRHTLATGEPYSAPSTVERRADIGLEEAYDWRIERMELPDGRFGVVCHFYDLSERRQWEDALRASEERYKAFVANSTEGVYRMEFDPPVDTARPPAEQLARAYAGGRFAECNDAFARMYGFDRADEIVGRGLDLMLPLDQPQAREYLLGVIAAGYRVSEVESEERDREGRPVFFSNSLSAVFDPAGRVARVWGTQRDVTARKRAEEALREKDAELQLVADATPVLLARCNRDLTYRFINRAGSTQLGHPPEAIVGRSIPEVLGAEAIAVIRPHVDAVLAGQTVEYEAEIPYPAVGRRHMRVTYTPERNATGEVVGWVASIIDQTDRKRAEEALRASEEKFRTLFESMDEGFCIIEFFDGPHGPLSDYVHVAANPAYTANAGIPDIVGQKVREMVPDEADAWVEIYRNVLVTGQPIRFERELVATGRHLELAAFRIDPVESRQVAVLFKDVTARKRAEEALREADRRKDEFLATLAHELRNPLAPVRTGLQVIRRSAADPAVVEKTAAMMERQLGHMVVLIDDLLDVSRITRGKLTLRREPVDLAAVVGLAVEAAAPLIEQAGHALSVALPDHPLTLDGDPNRLAQVVGNLLTNSAKYTPPGGRITLSAAVVGADVVVAVTDTGIGIPPAALGRVFDLFSQVDRTLEKTTGGLGIGLALVKGLVEMHGGTVAAHSDGEGKGSTFTVRLPVAVGRPTAAEPANGVPPPPTPARRKVLVVDDNVDAAESLAMLLEMTGHEVRTAFDGAQAVTAAEAFRPDLILMDVGMPKLSGLDATRRIRERPWGQAVHIVALTGWGQEADRERTAAAGCDAHLVKPVAPAAVAELLAGLPVGA